MLLLIGIALWLTFFIIGTYQHLRTHPGTRVETAALTVVVAAVGPALALVNLVGAFWFAIRLAADDVAKGVMRAYAPPGFGVDPLLPALCLGAIVLMIVAVAGYRRAIRGEP